MIAFPKRLYRPQATSQQGFTLIEMLVAMAIFSVLMGLLMMGFSQGLSLWQRADDKAGHWQSLEWREQLLQHLFEQALAADFPLANGDLPRFEGAPDALSFLSGAPILTAFGAIKPVQLKLDERDGAWRLLYREGRRGADLSGSLHLVGDEWVPLLTGLKHASFRYEAPVFPVPSGVDLQSLSRQQRLRYRQHPVWMADYDIQTLLLLPQRIELQFTDARGNRHRWRFFFRHHFEAWPMGVYFGA